MDQPDLDPRLHRQALVALDRINSWSRTIPTLWSVLHPHLVSSGSGRGAESLRLLDLATGGGGVPRGLAERARRAGVGFVAKGCDRSPTALDYARGRTTGSPDLDVTYERLEILTDPLPMDYDVVTCCLFLHHLSEDRAVELLGRMAEAAGQMIVVSDLLRSSPGWALAQVAAHLLTRSPVVRVDAPRSVEAAFQADEVLSLARRAGLEEVRLEIRWPYRFLLTARGAG